VTQQFKLLPNVAAVYCFRFAAAWLWNMYNNVTAELEGGDLERLPEVSDTKTTTLGFLSDENKYTKKILFVYNKV